MRTMFASMFDGEICWFLFVYIIFIASFTGRSIYVLTQFVRFTSNDGTLVHSNDTTMLWMVLLPALWDFVPIVCIVITHSSNFKESSKEGQGPDFDEHLLGRNTVSGEVRRTAAFRATTSSMGGYSDQDD
jgi:hypothetical protein